MAEYIEREAAIQAAKHAWAKGLEPTQYIEIIPTADAVEVVHGQWVNDDGYIVCSSCNTGMNLNGLWLDCSNANYCPNCGAKMDGGVDNDV